MFKKLLFTALLCPVVIFGQENLPNSSQNYDEIIANYKQLSLQQLIDTAMHYQNKNQVDTALICYNLLINTPVKDADLEQQKIIIEAYNKSAEIYTNLCDYRTSYEYLIKALLLCEKSDYKPYEPNILNNIGNIYYYFKKYEISKNYFLKAMQLCKNTQDTTVIVDILNNLGVYELTIGNNDSAFYFLNKALKISEKYNNYIYNSIINNLAVTYYNNKQYDSAFHYLRLSLDYSKKNNKIDTEPISLINLGNFFYRINQIDSALHYINLSHSIALENNFVGILSDNYLALSNIEESKGNIPKAFEYFKKYAVLKDSVFNVEKFGEINQLQRLYEVSKTNKQIEELIIEQQVKERTIKYQRIIWFITLGVLGLVIIVLFIITFQKIKLNKVYKALVEKNIEVIELQEDSSEIDNIKIKKKTLSNNMQDELIKKILNVMSDASVICDPNFSIYTLADLVYSNQKYVSEAINNSLNKNFRSFLNSYRIREAQRLFSDSDTEKYTIEYVAQQVGFKSRNSFNEAFKDVTLLSPGFYIKSLQNQKYL